MARSTNRSSKRNRSDYDEMSRDDLVAIIGADVDPSTSRADLIIMAIEADDSRDQT